MWQTDPKKQVLYPLKGFLIGNGITDWTYDAEASQYQTLAELNVIPYSLIDDLKTNNCQFNVALPFDNVPAC